MLDVSGGSAVATLQIPLELTGDGQIKAGLAGVGTAGEAAASRVTAAFDGVSTKAAGQARITAQAYSATLVAQFDADRARIQEGLARGFLTPAQAQQAGREAAQAYNAGLVAQLDQLGGAGLNVGNSALYADLAGSLKNVETASTNAGAGLGRLRYSLTSFVDSAAGVPPVLGRVASALGVMGAGLGPVIALTAGAAALAGAWELLTADARKAQEQQDKLTDSLDKWYQKQREGSAGELPAEIEAVTKKIQDLQKTLAHPESPGIGESLKAIFFGSVAGLVSFDPSTFANEVRAQFKKYYDAQMQGIEEGSAARDAAMAEADKRLRAAFLSEQSDVASALATIIQSGNATSAQYSAASGQIAKDESLIAGFQSKLATLSPASDTDTSHPYKDTSLAIAELIGDVKRLQDALTALTPAQKAVLDRNTELTRETELERTATQSLTDTITKGYEEMRRLESAAVVKSTIPPSDVFKITGGPLPDLSVLSKDVTKIEAGLNDLTREGLTAFTEGLTKSGEATAKADADAAHLANTVGRDLTRAVIDFASRSSFSFRDVFKTAADDAIRLVGTFDQGVAKLKTDLAEAAKAGLNVSQINADLASAETRLATIQKIASGLGGLSLGFSLGQQGNFAQSQAPLAGAAQGAQLPGIPGPVIGAFAGAIGGLIGAAEAHKQAAAALKAAGEAIDKSLASYGAGTGVAAQLAQNDATYQQLRDAITGNVQAAGKSGNRGALTQAAEQSQQLEKTRADNAAKIAQNFWEGITAQINATEGPAGDYQNSLNAITVQWLQNRDAANALHATDAELAQIDQLRDAQEKKLTATYQESLKQTQYTLDARELAAKGDSFLAEQTSRRAAEDKELFDAQQAGYTDAQLAQLKYIQGLEDEAALKKRLSDNLGSYASSVAAGPNGTASSRLTSDLFPLLTKQAQDQKDYDDAVAAGIDPVTKAALQIGLMADAAAIAATTFQDTVAALQQANSDIEQAVAGGFLSGTAGLGQERGNIATLAGVDVSGLSNDAAIRALYTIPDGVHDLTNQQRALNALIDQYFKDEQQWGQATASNTATIASAGGAGSQSLEQKAISDASGGITRQDGNRIADYMASELVVLKEIRDDARTHYGIPGAINIAAPFTTAPQFPSFPSFASSASRVPVALPPLKLDIDVTVSGDGTATPSTIESFKLQLRRALRTPEFQTLLKSDLDELLREAYADKARRAGDNTSLGN